MKEKTFNDTRKELKEEDVILYTRLELGGKLMALRNLQQKSQRKLSEESTVAQKTISRLENGKDAPTLETIVLLADALGYELNLVKKRNSDKQLKTFGDGYVYEDLVRSAAFGAIEGLEHLSTGIDNYLVMNAAETEFCTDLTGEEILNRFDKTPDEFKRDVVNLYVSERRKARKKKDK